MPWWGGWAGTVLSRRIALLYDIVDRPDHLVKTHCQPIAYLGGVGIFLGFAVGTLIGMGVLSFKSLQAEPFYQLIALIIGGALALVVGVTDDIHTLKPMQKIWGQVMAATILVLAGWWPDYDACCVSLGWEIPQGIITALEIVTVYAMVLLFCNALNLLDGIDGLCGGVSLIGTLGTLVLTLHIATWSQSLIEPTVLLITTLALAGALVGFLILNRPPAKIFMGDAGSLILGFWIAALVLKFLQMSWQYGLAVMVMFGLPLLDTAVAVVRRKFNSRPVFSADRGHLYDQMMDRGLSLVQTLMVCYGWAWVHVTLGLVMALVNAQEALIVLTTGIVTAWLAIGWKGYLKMEGLHGALPEANPMTPEPAGKGSR